MRERQSKLDCPSSRDLELYCLGELAAVTTTKFISTHLTICPRCRRHLRHLQSFYDILSSELDRPVEPRLLDFCKKRAPRPVKYGLLVCNPLPEKDRNRNKAYLTTLAFAANGDGSKTSLVDFTLSREQIGVMLYSDPQNNSLLLFLWNQGEEAEGCWHLQAPGLFDKAEFSPAGAAKIPLTNFEYLHNRLVYFSTVPNRRRRQRVLAQVRESLL
jgi:hypothetical protein